MIEKDSHSNSNQNKERVAILISDIIDYKPKIVKGDKGDYMLKNGSIH